MSFAREPDPVENKDDNEVRPGESQPARFDQVAVLPFFLATVLDSLDVALVCYDLDDRLVWWNSAAATFFPKAQQTLVAGTLSTDRLRAMEAAGYNAVLHQIHGLAPALDIWEMNLPDGRRLVRQRTRMPTGHRIVSYVDVSRRLSAESETMAALEAERERYALMIEGTRDGLYDHDVISGVTWRSPRSHEILGLPDGSLNGSRQKTLDQMHPDDAVWYERLRDSNFAQRLPISTVTMRFRHADGGWRWITSRARIVYSELGEPVRVVGSWADVTDQREADERLRASEERYQRVLEGTSDGIYDHDHASGTIWLSERAHQILGLANGTLNGSVRNIDNLIVPADVKASAQSRAEAARRREPSYSADYQVRHADGSWRWLAARARIVYDASGAVIRTVGSFSDVTAQKRAEEALRESEKLLRDAQRLARIGSWKWTPEGRRYWSDQMYDLFPLPRGALPTSEQFLALIHPDDRDQIGLSYSSAASSGATALAPQSQYRVVWPDGHTLILAERAVIERDSAGRVISVSGTIQDVTERVEAERAIQSNEARLSTILDTAMVGFISIDEQGHIVNFNAEAAAIFGYSAAEMLGLNIDVLIPALDRAAHRRRQGQAAGAAKRIPMSNWRGANGLHRDGTLLPLIAGIAEVKIGNKITTKVVFRDMSDAKVAENELRRRSEEKQQQMDELGRRSFLLQTVMDTVTDGMVVVADEGGAVLWNQGFLKLAALAQGIDPDAVAVPAGAAMADLLALLKLAPESIGALLADAGNEQEHVLGDGRALKIQVLRSGEGSSLLRISDITRRHEEKAEETAAQDHPRHAPPPRRTALSKLLANLQFRTLIRLSLLLPMLGLLAFGGHALLREVRTVESVNAVERLARLAPEISTVVQELQKERGNSAGFIVSKGGEPFADRLAAQRSQTDRMREKFGETIAAFDAAAYGTGLARTIEEATSSLGRLDAHRQVVSALSLDVPDMTAPYSSTIAHLLDVIAEMAALSSDASLNRAITAYISLLQATERAGQQRAVGSAAFSDGAFEPVILQRFIALTAEQDALLSVFRATAAPELVRHLDKVLADPAVVEVERLRRIAVATPYGGDLQGIAGGTWFDAITRAINLLNGIEDNASEHLLTQAGKLVDRANRALATVGTLAAALLAVTILFTTMLVRSITRPVARLTQAMTMLAGGDRTVKIDGTDLENEIGSMARALVLFKDNALAVDRLQAERAIQSNEARLSTILDTAMVGFISVNEQGHIVNFNAEAAAIFGYSAAEMLGLNIDVLIPVLDRAAYRRMPGQAAGAAKRIPMSNWRGANGVHRDGTLLPLIAGISKVKIGDKVTMTVIFRDMSDIQVAENELRRLSEEKQQQIDELGRRSFLLQTVMDTVTDGMVVVADEGGAVLWNQGFLKLAALAQGIGPDAVTAPTGAAMADLLALLKLAPESIGALLADAGNEQEHVLGDGRALKIQVLRSGEGSSLLWISDITRRREEEVERMALQERLLQSQKNDAIGAIAGTVSHDFNNLLTIILGFATLSKAQLDVLRTLPGNLPTDDPQAKRTVDHVLKASNSIAKSLDNIITGAGRGKSIVANLTSFAQRRPSDLAVLDLSQTMDAAVRLIAASMPASITFKAIGIGETLTVRHDRGKIEQVLLNLCINSAHAVGERAGSITVRIGTLRTNGGRAGTMPATDATGGQLRVLIQEAPDGWCHLWQGVLPPGDYVRVDVTDTGVGMTAEIMKQIFDPFFTTKSHGQGTGLGLLSVSLIVDEHGGGVHVKSREGDGTVFSIFLPLADAEIATVDPAPAALTELPAGGLDADGPASSDLVLVVDDEEALTEIVQISLERSGYRIEAFRDPTAALERFQADPDAFTLVITDQTMPLMTGMELAAKVSEVKPGMPVLLCTGYSARAIDEKRLPTGVAGLLRKPFTPKDLVQKVKVLLDAQAQDG